MSFEVRLSPDALADLADIYDWIAASDGAVRAARVQDRILATIATLAQHPERGDRKPRGTARVLLNVIAKEPDAVLRALVRL